MFFKRVQIGLIHAAVAMTLLPINSTLNRVMIKELAISATLVAMLASLPYLFSPIQVAIGTFSDRHPIWGFKRTPYIILGLILCVLGVMTAPFAAYWMPINFWGGLFLGILTFGAWGMGYNFAAVSYFTLASELSDSKGRSKTITVMFVLMIVTMILTSLSLSRMLDEYSAEILIRSFWIVGVVALILGAIGLIRLEKRDPGMVPPSQTNLAAEPRESLKATLHMLQRNPQVKNFFMYLVLMLAAILGQDVLLEPFAGEALGMSVGASSRITSIWGVTFLVSLALAIFLERRLSKQTVARMGAWGGILAFGLIAASGLYASLSLFYSGVVLLGTATGLATVSNLSLMLDMTIPGMEGLFIGAWGMANAFSRLVGSVLSGAIRDISSNLLSNLVGGYVIVFLLEGLLLFISLLLLRRIDIRAFQNHASQINVAERMTMAGEV
jgi:BCD family chlorophyll transporter-like MFS transporter